MAKSIDDLNFEMSDYDYELPDEKIAQYPVKERDGSRLLVYNDSRISSDLFRNIINYLPEKSLLVFNNTRVIRARLLFRKDSGAKIEILCLEPLIPENYEISFRSKNQVEWKCIIGNLKKWKNRSVSLNFAHKGISHILVAEKVCQIGEAWRIRFSWDSSSLSFGEVIEFAGHVPLPPYIKREDEEGDAKSYQTVYSRIEGSVAAPTAGLHFTEYVLNHLSQKKIRSAELTLHVGAGTFQPVNSDKITGHEMHSENFYVTAETVELLRENQGNIISVGTTSLRTLESIYWIGVRILEKPEEFRYRFIISQWEPYKSKTNIEPDEALHALSDYMRRNNITVLNGSTSLIIVPGYKFRMIHGLITNFHQPRSTLLLLVSAWVGNDWKKIYDHALDNNFRFLSYGDSSLLFKPSIRH
ncbi:MAG: S-adenosylmethionine:tRNA ribosyltransferase-isomerase [Bacteroidales bacterium]|nr:S-adenosylmethionine:tRNA ribosyltransferase-isomerase [Bacteroidales bacterium]